MNSRSIIYSLLSDTAQAAFFVCCYRDDDVKPGNEFSKWLESLESCGIKKVEVEKPWCFYCDRVFNVGPGLMIIT